MPRLIWTGPTLADIHRLYQFPALKSQDAARRAVGAIRSQVRILQDQPEVGRALADTDPEYRTSGRLNPAIAGMSFCTALTAVRYQSLPCVTSVKPGSSLAVSAL